MGGSILKADRNLIDEPDRESLAWNVSEENGLENFYIERSKRGMIASTRRGRKLRDLSWKQGVLSQHPKRQRNLRGTKLLVSLQRTQKQHIWQVPIPHAKVISTLNENILTYY